MANMISLWLEGEGLVDAGDAGEDALIPKKQAYDGWCFSEETRVSPKMRYLLSIHHFVFLEAKCSKF